MNPRVLVPALFVIGTFATTAFALPRIGYVYPAGGQAGSSFEVIMGGQSLDQPLGVVISGEGVSVEVVEHDKIPSAQVIDDYRDKFRELKPELAPLKGSSPGAAKSAASITWLNPGCTKSGIDWRLRPERLTTRWIAEV